MRYLFASNSLAMAMTTLRAFALLRILDPSELGIWKSLMLLLPVAGWFRLAFSRGLSTQVPYLLGQGKAGTAAELCSSASFVQFGTGLLFAAGALAASFKVDAAWQLPLQLMSLVLVTGQVHGFYRDLVVVHQCRQARGRGLLIAAGTDMICSLGFAAVWGIPGLAAGTILGLAIPAFYLSGQAPAVMPKWDAVRVAGLWKAGWRMAAIDVAQTATRYVDIAVVAALGGPVATGHYALAQMVAEAGNSLTQVAVAEVMGPKILHQAGAEDSLTGAARFAAAAARRLMLVLPPLLLVATLAVEPMVERFLPRYAAGAGGARIMLWAVLFWSCQAAVQPLLVAAGQLMPVVRMAALLLPISAGAQVLAWHAGWGLEGVAGISVANAAAFALGCIWRARHLARKSTERKPLVSPC